MVAGSSLSAELLAVIQVPNLRPMPAYLSESDALNVADFMQPSYASDYAVNVSNMHWVGEMNVSHLFNIFSNFHAQKDSVKTCLDMITFVTENMRRYSWDGDLFLQLNGLTLDTWLKKMSYWGNCGDALSIYAMSDMFGVHSCVITQTKLWTTVANRFQDTVMDVLKICQVKLIYLGNHKYGRWWEKTAVDTPSYLSANYNYLPMLQQPPPPPLIRQLETANTLLNMQAQSTASTSNETEMPPSAFEKPPIPETVDAMDKIVGRFDICVTPLEDIVFDKPDSKPKLPPSVEPNDLPTGEHYTRSHTRKPQICSNRIPRKASSGVQYGEPEEIDVFIKKQRPISIKPQASGPSETSVSAQRTKSKHPSRRLPQYLLTEKEMMHVKFLL